MKLKHYPSVWQAQPFSMELFAHFEEAARLQNKEVVLKRKRLGKQTKTKSRFTFGFW
ncbi:hypothetical protein MTsPCn5_14270 [Croceitalea sp. MTPC5]|nr:hypothetical protein MTsPCn5_14270 [Croceitalea sp. MTPC5]